MYCEIFVKHRKRVDAAGLERAIRVPFDNDVTVAVAYGRSAIYQRLVPPLAPAGAPPPPPSLFAFETVQNCFVIVRKVNVLLSTYHLEGNTSAVPVETLLQAVQEFSGHLMGVLEEAQAPAYRARTLTVVLFEDNGRETGMQGELITLSSVFGQEFSWKDLKSIVIPFITAGLLIWLGLKQERIKVSIYTLVIALAFTLSQVAVGYWRGHGKIKWKLRQS
jgi:hypothetical protein